jgi:hypothetical protein
MPDWSRYSMAFGCFGAERPQVRLQSRREVRLFEVHDPHFQVDGLAGLLVTFPGGEGAGSILAAEAAGQCGKGNQGDDEQDDAHWRSLGEMPLKVALP